MLATASPKPQPGDTVVLHFSHSEIKAVVLERAGRLQCKSGIFEHDAILATPFGRRVPGRPAARGEPIPQPVVLRLTPELWTQTLRHRTQIIYMTDIAVVIQHLRLRPGSVIAEAGTGSGSLTHSLARAVAPTGKVFTFDFHKSRADEARKEFASHGLGDVIVSGWCDVCRPGQGVDVPPALLSVDPKMAGGEGAVVVDGAEEDGADAPPPATEGEPPAGYGLDRATVDAVFLDVPAPWLAVPNVLHVLRMGGAVCSYSPCIEQTLKFCTALRKSGEFLDLHTVEALTREYAPVFPSHEAPAPAPAKQADGNDAAPPATRVVRREGVQFTPRPEGKGHSAYLTFARRRRRDEAQAVADATAAAPAVAAA